MAAKRRTRDETRTLMLEAGSDVLLRDGIGFGASTFRYADAFALLREERDIKVTRGSVHERIWSSQEAWQLDVLAASIERNEAGRRSFVDAAVIERFSELPVETPVDRLNALAESCRVGSLTFLETVEANPSFRLLPTVVSAWKASSNPLPEFDRLGAMLIEIQRATYGELRSSMAVLLTALQLDGPAARGLTFDDAVGAYCINATALAYSHTLRSRHDPVLMQRISARGPDGEHRPWNHLGLSLWLIARGLFRPSNDPSNPADSARVSG